MSLILNPLLCWKGADRQNCLVMKLIMYLDGAPVAELPVYGSNFQLSQLMEQLIEQHKEAVRTAKTPPCFALAAASGVGEFVPLKERGR